MVHVDFRARLAGSGRPRRIFEATVEVAGAAGPIGAKRALDSTPIYDAVATMGTITLMRSAMRGLLKAADDGLEAELRGVTRSGDGYATSAKPQVDWDDQGARDELVATRARDGHACLALLEGRDLAREVEEAAELLASVLGQDLEGTEDGSSRTARKVAKDQGRLYGRPRGPPRQEDLGASFRRLPGPHSGRPRQRDDHRHHRHGR